MDRHDIVVIIIILECITSVFCDGNNKVHVVTMYTDLVDIIGKKDSCAGHQRTNTSNETTLFSKAGIVLSNYDFHVLDVHQAIIGKCESAEVKSHSYNQYNWTCFTTENSTLRETNWFFVDCLELSVFTIKCLDFGELTIIIENLCDGKPQTNNGSCHEFSYGKEESTVCSKNFRLRRVISDVVGNPASYTTPGDITAYLCVAFILITFLLAVLIPAEKCKPIFKSGKENGLRVPLQIYEMYGVSYKPAAKKRRDRMSVNMNVIPAISSHMDNVATLSNKPVDWKGYKTHFKFQQNNQQPLNLATTGADEKIDTVVKDKQFRNGSRANSYNQSQECSFENPRNFDVGLFHNVLEEEVGNLTSERMKALFSDERRRSTSCSERRQHYRNVHRSKTMQRYSYDGAAELGITNNGYVKEWIGENGETEEECSQCHCNTPSVDNANQRISITIEDPSTNGSRNGRTHEHGPVKKSNPARINKRCYSTEVHTREKVHQKLARKYSMC